MFKITSMIFMVLLSTPVAAMCASFDCNGKLSDIEAIICSDNKVSIMDSELGAKYRLALHGRNDIGSSQREWLKNRNACDNLNCLRSLYKGRIIELDEIISNYYKIVPLRDGVAFLEGWNKDSEMGIGLACAERSRRLSGLLDIEYSILSRKLMKIDKDNEFLTDSIKREFNSWKGLLVDECGLVFQLGGGTGGGQGSFQQACIYNMLEDRYRKTLDTIVCIEMIGHENKSDAQFKCLAEIISLKQVFEYVGGNR